MTLESIAWRGVHIEVPDTNRTVLVYGPQLELDDSGELDADKHVWLGWYERGEWFDVSALPLAGVTDWAEMPTGAE